MALEHWSQPCAGHLRIPLVAMLIRKRPVDSNDTEESLDNKLARMLIEILTKLRPAKRVRSERDIREG